MKKKVLIPALGLLVVDIITKLLIDNSFNLMETKPIILNFFAITKVYNDGANTKKHNIASIKLPIILLIPISCSKYAPNPAIII